MTKICCRCGKEKKLDEFGKRSSSKDGLFSCCKECKNKRARENYQKSEVKQDKKEYRKKNRKKNIAYLKQYRQDNKEELNQKSRERYRDNKEKLNQKSKEWREKNKEKLKRKKKEYAEKNKEKLKKYRKEYYQKNKERKKQESKQYYKENKKKITKRKREYKKRKKRNDPNYKLRENVSRSINDALKRSNGGKNGGSILNYLPYSIQQLKEHLESQFEPWMSWDNYGVYEEGKLKWHIDHIIPQSKLLYDSMEHPNFQKCWSLENLRPLEAIENIKKSNKLE